MYKKAKSEKINKIVGESSFSFGGCGLFYGHCQSRAGAGALSSIFYHVQKNKMRRFWNVTCYSTKTGGHCSKLLFFIFEWVLLGIGYCCLDRWPVILTSSPGNVWQAHYMCCLLLELLPFGLGVSLPNSSKVPTLQQAHIDKCRKEDEPGVHIHSF